MKERRKSNLSKEGNKMKMIVFDVDGVLIDEDRGGFKDILIRLGKEQKVKWIDREYQKRKHEGPWGLKQLAQAYQGFQKDTLEKEAREYYEERLMEGAQRIIAELKREGFIVGALSSNPQFIMDQLEEKLGLNFTGGCRLKYEDEEATGDLAREVDRCGKAEILREKKEEYDIPKEKIVVIGDSLTDLPMAEEAGFFVGFNAKEEIQDKLDIRIDGKDLTKVLDEVGHKIKDKKSENLNDC